MLGKVDIEANVEGGGPSGQAGAIRWGVSMALRSFVDADTIDRMRLGEFAYRDLTFYLLTFNVSTCSWSSATRLENEGKKEVWTGRRSQKVHLEEAIILHFVFLYAT